MKFKLVESAWNENEALEKENFLIKYLEPLSEKELLDITGIRLSDSPPSVGGCYITQSGKYLNFDWAEADMHIDIISDMLETVYAKIIVPDNADISDMDYEEWLGSVEVSDMSSWLIDYFEKHFVWVRANAGNSWTEDRLYFAIPDGITTAQMYAIVDFLKEFESEKDEFEAYFYKGDWVATYKFNEVSPDKFLNIMRRYISTGMKPLGESRKRRAK